jgi:hypothetical protein
MLRTLQTELKNADKREYSGKLRRSRFETLIMKTNFLLKII